tara:strand:+ start:75 stop:197 length:123 start_codon:yes stop_codon:yes gene_type:complete
MLSSDPNTEQFVGDGAEEANRYLQREYRVGFEVSDMISGS